MRHNRLATMTALFPEPTVPVFSPGSYVGCPMVLVQAMTAEQLSWHALVYLVAFQQAQATLRPSLLERDLLGVWN